MWEILKASGVDPSRRSGPTWSQFLRSQAEAILACDFFTADLLDGTCYRPIYLSGHRSMINSNALS